MKLKSLKKNELSFIQHYNQQYIITTTLHQSLYYITLQINPIRNIGTTNC